MSDDMSKSRETVSYADILLALPFLTTYELIDLLAVIDKLHPYLLESRKRPRPPPFDDDEWRAQRFKRLAEVLEIIKQET